MTDLKRGATKDDKALGSRIRARRMAIGLKQAELGQSVGVSYQQIQKYEAGKDRLSGSRLGRVAAALQTDPNTLLGDDLRTSRHSSAVDLFISTKEGVAIAECFALLDLSVKRAIIKLAEGLVEARKGKKRK